MLAAGVASSSTRDDFKLLLSAADVAAALGDAGIGGVMVALESVRGGGGGELQPLDEQTLVWALRRTEPSGRWIGFRECCVRYQGAQASPGLALPRPPWCRLRHGWPDGAGAPE